MNTLLILFYLSYLVTTQTNEGSINGCKLSYKDKLVTNNSNTVKPFKKAENAKIPSTLESDVDEAVSSESLFVFIYNTLSKLLTFDGLFEYFKICLCLFFATLSSNMLESIILLFFFMMIQEKFNINSSRLEKFIFAILLSFFVLPMGLRFLVGCMQ